ncbi:E3 ubiquitin-protein ligase SIAH1 [Platysternon megacephalum]|uniref:E3 ubiquitin-protein ligase SIAH1 n=1 Tax=Platysternon megacephalum TaxID=55544 RepID=A0A4D9ETN2_9SAUR|nr:E3 ubiquitin-protein ligase SIAH1 [Platysternon megacephalum]
MRMSHNELDWDEPAHFILYGHGIEHNLTDTSSGRSGGKNSFATAVFLKPTFSPAISRKVEPISGECKDLVCARERQISPDTNQDKLIRISPAGDAEKPMWGVLLKA